MPDGPDDYDFKEFPPFAVTTDIVLFTVQDRSLQTLLIRRGEWPFAGFWALPGGFVREGETLDETARRELFEETHVTEGALKQFGAYGDPGRDPRGRVVTVAYTALVSRKDLTLRAGTDAADVRWVPVDAPRQPLAFDHDAILKHALSALRERLETSSTVAKAFLPTQFTLSRMQEVYETLLGVRLDKRNFRKWLETAGLVIKVEGELSRGPHRPAQLYEFSPSEPNGRPASSLRSLRV